MNNLFFDSELVREGEIYGETVYSNRLVAPKWYWVYSAVKLFLGIVWRPVHSDMGDSYFAAWRKYRMSFSTACEVVWSLNSKEISGSKWLCNRF